LSTAFVLNLITNRVLSSGTKFAPTKVTPVWSDIFEHFNDFRRKLKNILFFHLKYGNQKFGGNFPFFLKSFWETDENFPFIDNFCWSVRDRIADLVNSKSKTKAASNLSNAEKTALKKLITTKNKKLVISDTDKNVGPSISDKEDVISECNRQLCDISVYRKLDSQGVQKLILEVKKDFSY
jgi:hypothetical protein